MTKLIVTVEANGTVSFNSPESEAGLIDVCESVGALLSATEEYIDGLTEGLTEEQKAIVREITSGSDFSIEEAPTEKLN